MQDRHQPAGGRCATWPAGGGSSFKSSCAGAHSAHLALPIDLLQLALVVPEVLSRVVLRVGQGYGRASLAAP